MADEDEIESGSKNKVYKIVYQHDDGLKETLGRKGTDEDSEERVKGKSPPPKVKKPKKSGKKKKTADCEYDFNVDIYVSDV